MTQFRIISLAVLAITPISNLEAFTDTIDLINAFGGVLNSLVAILVALALLVFIWGLAKFIFHVSGDEKAVEEGKRVMKWGLIALFIMVSVWGIIELVQEDLGLDGGSGSDCTGAEIWMGGC